VTTVGDQFLSAEHFLECTLDGVRLRMAIALGDGDRTVPRDTGEGESIASRLREAGERLPFLVWVTSL
jgi:hypothetical protein